MQFIAQKFTDLLNDSRVKISMDGRGRAYEYIFVELLWRTVKQEEDYLHDNRTVNEAKKSRALFSVL